VPKTASQKTRVKPGAPQYETVAPGGSYLSNLHSAVREHFAGAVDLKTFLSGLTTLTPAEKRSIALQALILIEQNYAHLPLKRAMHSIDPVQRLKLLLQRLDLAPSGIPLSDREFHREMTDIFISVRDLHTNYLLPAPYNGMTAFLPFMVEDFFEDGEMKYMVSHVSSGFSHATFVPGVELIYWNGMPIERAVWSQAQRYAGSNADARHARGVQTLTARALVISPPPEEEWVTIIYRTLDGEEKEMRFDWMVNAPPVSGEAAETSSDPAAFASLGVDLEQETVQRVRKALFKPQVVADEQRAHEKVRQGESFADLESSMPNVFEARHVDTPAGTFGYIRIRTFNVWPPDEFVGEFIRLISALPQDGLIIDVRGNGGGVIMNGELILQTLTPRRIQPEPVQFVNTPLNLEICRRHGPVSAWADLSPWVQSLQEALQTGAAFSAGFPISDPEACNAMGQKYFGPSVLIIDALCYSTTDIFASGFQDHEIGPVLGTDGNTGAGGANVWTHQHLLQHVLPGPDSVYQPLPKDAGMRVSIRRTLRVGKRAGTPLEDLGVIPDHRHQMTRADVLNNNVDLIAKAGSLLADQPKRRLRVSVQRPSTGLATVVAESAGMTRLDLYVDDRPVQSLDIEGERTEFESRAMDAESTAEIRGFSGNHLVARYRARV
jgi:hypothetical protein